MLKSVRTRGPLTAAVLTSVLLTGCAAADDAGRASQRARDVGKNVGTGGGLGTGVGGVPLGGTIIENKTSNEGPQG